MKATLAAALLVLATFIPAVSTASSDCWLRCTDDGRSTKSCVSSCGLRSEYDRMKCWDHCDSRGGSRKTCYKLCDLGSPGPDEDWSKPGRGGNDPTDNPKEKEPDNGRDGRQGSQCRMNNDCPTFSFCSNGWCERHGGEGAQCRMNNDCPTFSSCQNGWCVGTGGEGTECRLSHHCPTFFTCNNGWCVK